MAKILGAIVDDWTPPPAPSGQVLQGQYAVLEPLNVARHSAELHCANMRDAAGENWDYLPYGPFESEADYAAWAQGFQAGTDPVFYAIKSLETGHFCGVASYLRVASQMGSIEVGHINYAPELQRSRAATEAMYLMMKWAFEVGYRRYEWKCNSLNEASCRAALRLGFSYEGVFRQAAISKGRNRDTTWFAAIDKEWPALELAYQRWLDPANFDADGKQKTRLGDLTAAARI